MAANLGQAFLGATGMVPTLAQEIASANFHENRESFHDYIYSKLILGEDKIGNPGIPISNPPVFPNSNLASSYPTSLAVTGIHYGHVPISTGHNMAETSNTVGGKAPAAHSANKPQGSQKSGSSKKKSFNQQNPAQHQQIFQGSVPEASSTKKKSHHKKKDKSNVCDVCGRGFAEKYTLNRHLMTHTHVKPFSCTKCNMSFSRSDGLAKHMAAGHRRIDAHHCDVCGGTFNSEVSYEQHRREYGNTLPFVCNLCMLAFSQCCHLNYHMKSHGLSKLNDSIPSDIDNKNPIDVSELVPEDCSPPKKSEPTTSQFNFALSSPRNSLYLGRQSTFDLHAAYTNILIKPELDEMPACQSLGPGMSSYDKNQNSKPGTTSFTTLNNYITTPSSTPQHGTPNIQTSQSGSLPNIGSSSASAMLLHTSSSNLNSSSEGSPLSESEVNKYLDIKIPNPRFLENSLLQGAGSNEEGMFRCEFCGKGFTRKYHMQRHVKLHIRGPIPRAHLLDWTRRPYACGVCKMGFTRQHHLTRHMLIHTGERPHACHICGKAFRRYTNLTLHVRTVHGAERPFKCQICGRGFPRLYSLQRHIKLHAKNAVGLLSDQLYKSFNEAGRENLDQKDFSIYGSDKQNLQQSPGHSRDSLSSNHSDDSEDLHEDSSGHDGSIDPGDNGSPIPNHNQFQARQGDKSEPYVNHSNEQATHLKQGEVTSGQSSLVQHNSSTPDLDVNKSKSNAVNNVTLAVANSNSQMQPEMDAGRLMQDRIDFSQQPLVRNLHTDRFNSVNSVSCQNLRPANSSSRSFIELDIRETYSHMLSQRMSSIDGYSLPQQRNPSPHQGVNLDSRSSSQPLLSTQNNGPESYIQAPAGYIQAATSVLNQQHATLDVTSAHQSVGSLNNPEPGSYSHALVNLGTNHTGESQTYSHNHVASTLAFPAGVHVIYPQAQQQQRP